MLTATTATATAAATVTATFFFNLPTDQKLLLFAVYRVDQKFTLP